MTPRNAEEKVRFVDDQQGIIGIENTNAFTAVGYKVGRGFHASFKLTGHGVLQFLAQSLLVARYSVGDAPAKSIYGKGVANGDLIEMGDCEVR